MSEQAILTAEVESLWLSFKFNKVYLTAKTLNHCVADNHVVEEKFRKVSLIFANPTAEDLQFILTSSNNIAFVIDTGSQQIVDKNGYVLNRYRIQNIKV